MSQEQEEALPYPCGYCEQELNYADMSELLEHPCFEGYAGIGIYQDKIHSLDEHEKFVVLEQSGIDDELLIPENGGGKNLPSSVPVNTKKARKANDSTKQPIKRQKSILSTAQAGFLITEVQSRPPLWSSRTTPAEREKHKVAKLWEEVASQAVFDGKITGVQARIKFKSLIDTMRQFAQKAASGSEAGKSPRTWPHWESLQFIRDEKAKNVRTASNVSRAPEVSLPDTVSETLFTNDNDEEDPPGPEQPEYVLPIVEENRQLPQQLQQRKRPQTAPAATAKNVPKVTKKGNEDNLAEAIVELAEVIGESSSLPLVIPPQPTIDAVDGMLAVVGGYVRSMEDPLKQIIYSKQVQDYAFKLMLKYLGHEPSKDGST